MPYQIKKVGQGYKVQKKGSTKTFSKRPLLLARAKAQMLAIELSEAKSKRRR